MIPSTELSRQGWWRKPRSSPDRSIEDISRSRHHPTTSRRLKHLNSLCRAQGRQKENVFPVLHRQSNLSHILSRRIFPCPAPAGTHTLLAAFQFGGGNVNLDGRIQSSSFILITAVTQDARESVRNHCNLCWHICGKVTGEPGQNVWQIYNSTQQEEQVKYIL